VHKKFGEVPPIVFEICERTPDRQTDRPTHHNISHCQKGVRSRMLSNIWSFKLASKEHVTQVAAAAAAAGFRSADGSTVEIADLVSVQTQRIYNLLKVTGTRSYKWTGISVLDQDQVHQFAILFMLYRKMLFNVVQVSLY